MSVNTVISRLAHPFSLRLGIVLGLLLLGALALQSASAVVPPGQISDAAHLPGRAGFHFLPPMVSDPGALPGTSDTTLAPTATICRRATSDPFNCVATVAMFNSDGSGGASSQIVVDPKSETYNTVWSVPKNITLSTSGQNPTYRLSVFVGSIELGFAGLYIVKNAKDLKDVPDGYIGVVAGSRFTIKFSIAVGTVGTVTVDPAAANVGVGGTQVFSATVTDLHGDAIPSPTVSWTSADTTIATVSPASGTSTTATGVSSGTTEIIATSGGVSGQASLQVNIPPTIVCDDTATTDEDISVTAECTIGDAETAANDLIVTALSHNAALVAASGLDVDCSAAPLCLIEITPQPNANGSVNITVTVEDADGGTASHVISLTVVPVDDAPVAVDDSATVDEDAGANPIDVLANDSDTDGGPKTIISASDPANGSVVVAGDGLSLTYAPDANLCNEGGSTDDFTYTLNGGSEAKVSVAVSCVNDPPSFTVPASAPTVNEDSGAQTVNSFATSISAGPADEAGQTVSFDVSNDNSALFSAQPAIAQDGTLTYTAAADANGTATVEVTLIDDGDTANEGDNTSEPQTFTITVNAANDEPSFSAGDDVDVLEDNGTYSAAWATAISAGPSDESGQALTFNLSNDNNALFSTEPAISSAGVLSFTPAANAFGSATVSVYLMDNGGMANGGDDTSPTVMFEITVTPVNDAPSFTVGPDQSVSQNTGEHTVANWATGFDPGPANEAGQAVLDYIVNVQTNPGIFLVAPDVANDGTLTFTPVAVIAEPTTAIIEIQVQDDGGTDNGGVDTSAVQTFEIEVVPNAAPTITCDTPVSTPEDTPASSNCTVDDLETAFGDLTVTAMSNNSALVADDSSGLTVTCTTDPTCVIGITPQPNVSGGPFNVTVTVEDEAGATAQFNIAVTITAVDDPPVAVADAATVVEDSGANAIDVLVNDTDIDAGPISVQSVTQPANGTVVITGGGTGLTYQPNPNYCNTPPGTTLDTFTYTLNGGSSTTVTVTVDCVDDNPVAVADAATVTEDSGANAVPVLANDTDVDGGPISITSVTQPANGTVAITGGGTGVTYTPDLNYCNDGTPTDDFTYTLTPGGSSTTVAVTVTCVDDPPVAVADAATVIEDSGANAIDVLANDTDIDGGPKTVQSVTQPANGTVAITGGGTGLTYAPNANYCNDGSPTDDFTYTLNGGSSTTVSVSVTCVNDPPVAAADTFDTVGNTTLVVDVTPPATPNVSETTTGGAGVLENDSDPVEGDTITITGIVGCGDVTAPFDCPTAGGGAVSFNTDGSFTFTPDDGDTGSDSFQYTITDDGTPTPATATGTVTINLVEQVWYVDSSAAMGGTGTSASPFNSFTPLNNSGADVDDTGDYIYLNSPDITGSLTLENDQRLIGEGVALQVPVALNGNASPATLAPAGARPEITASADTITLGTGNTIRGLELGNTSAANTRLVGTAVGTLTISDVSVFGTGRIITIATGGTLAATFDMLASSSSSGGAAIDLNGVGGTLTVTNNAGTDTAISGAASGIEITGATATANFNFAETSLSSSGTALNVSTNNVAAATTFASLSATASAGTGILASSGGIVNVGGTANTATATGGPAVDLTSTSLGSGWTFATVSSSGSPGDGVNLATVSGNFIANGGTIANAAGIAFDLEGGNSTVTYAGAITNGAGQSVEVTARTGGTTTFSGNITDSNDLGGGITLASNTGGATNFTGQLTLDTGTSAAFSASGNIASSVTATNAANTLVTTTGTALNVANTTIGASGLRFASISSNGAASGIILNTTGSTGGRLVVGPEGAGGACNSVATCAGGAIQNSTGVGISLTNTRNVSLTEMFILNGNSHGVSGTGMSDATSGANPTFLMANSFLDGISDSDNESALFFDTVGVTNITGVMTVANTTIQNFEDVGVHVGNNSGTLTVNLTDLTVNNNSDTNGEEGADIASDQTATITVNVSGGTYTDLEGGAFNFIADGETSTMHFNIDGVMVTGSGGPDNFPTPPAMTFSSDGSGTTMTFDITNNSILDASGDGIFIGHEGAIMGRITGNDISGMQTGDGIRIDTDTSSTTTSTILIDDNDIDDVGDDGIQVLHRDGTKTLNLTITNNTITNSASEGIRYFTDDDVAGGGPTNRVNISNNTFGSNGTVDTSDSIVIISQDAGTEVCTSITGNISVEGITLQQSVSAVLSITQADTAALSTANGGATVTPIGTITFNAACVVPTPTNP